MIDGRKVRGEKSRNIRSRAGSSLGNTMNPTARSGMSVSHIRSGQGTVNTRSADTAGFH